MISYTVALIAHDRGHALSVDAMWIIHVSKSLYCGVSHFIELID